MYGVMRTEKLNNMKEQIKIALWNKVKSTYPIGMSKHTNALLEEDFESFIDEVEKICTIHAVVGQSEQLKNAEQSGYKKGWEEGAQYGYSVACGGR